MMQVSAAVKLIPRPPALVLSKKSLVSSSLKYLWISVWRSSSFVRPSSWQYLYLNQSLQFKKVDSFTKCNLLLEMNYEAVFTIAIGHPPTALVDSP